MRRLLLLLLLMAVGLTGLALPGCATSVAGKSTRVSYNNGVTVAGVVTYRERIALPEHATVTVRLLDTTSEAAPITLAQQTIVKPGQPPIPFVMVLEPSKIDQNHTYAIEAEISVGKRGVWTTAARQAAITRGSPTTGLTVWLERTRPEPQANE